MEDGSYQCQITSCKKDARLDVQASTKGAVQMLKDTWSDQELKKSGSLVQLTILAHNVGYNDARFGSKNKSNIVPAYNDYLAKTKKTTGTSFYGDNILCSKDKDPFKYPVDTCGGVLSNQAQNYGYNVVAQHMLAVCFYAKNYPQEATFASWKPYLSGYCTKINVPTLDALNAK